jgi:hypothetical protein
MRNNVMITNGKLGKTKEVVFVVWMEIIRAKLAYRKIPVTILKLPTEIQTEDLKNTIYEC